MKPSDNKCSIIRTGNLFQQDPQDPDCSASNINGIIYNGNKVQVYSGNGSTSSVELKTDGTATITESKPQVDGTTKTTTINTSAPNATTGEVTITGKAESIQAGTGNLAGTGTQPFDKTGLATTEKQDAIKGSIDGISDKIGDPSGLTGIPETDNSAWQDGLNTGTATGIYNDVKSSLKSGWGFGTLIPAATCSPITKTVMGSPVEINICPAVDMIRAIVGWMLYLLTGWAVFRILTRVPG